MLCLNDSKSCRPVKSTTSDVAALTKSPIGSCVVSSIGRDVQELEEDHQADGQHGVVGGADVGHVVVHLVGHQPELLKDQSLGNLAHALRAALGRMPDERVQPLAGPGHEQRRAVFDPPLNASWFLPSGCRRPRLPWPAIWSISSQVTSWWTRGSNQTSAGPARCSCRPSR